MLYHHSYSAAIKTATESCIELGYTYNDDEFYEIVAIGTCRPKIGETTRFSLPLYRNNEKSDLYLHVQVYGMESGLYELNFYIL